MVMKIGAKFLTAELAWATGIFLILVAFGFLDSDPHSVKRYVRWAARAFALAAFPAGISVGPNLIAERNRIRAVVGVVSAACAVALLVFALNGFATPPLATAFGQMNAADHDWETRNHAAWLFYNAFFIPLNGLLFAAIGVQVAIWAHYGVRPVLRRLLYWTVGLGLLLSGYVIWDTTYEAVVIRTAADVSFAAFYTLLIPGALAAGLLLPTIAFLRRVPFMETYE